MNVWPTSMLALENAQLILKEEAVNEAGAS